MLEFDDIQHFLLTRAPALTRAVRISVVPRRRRRPRLGVGDQGDDSFGGVDARRHRPRQALGDGGFHLERPARARTGRGFARLFPGGVQAGHGGPGCDARRRRHQRPRTLGRRARQPRSACHRHPLCARRSGARPVRPGAREAHRRLPRRRSPLRARPQGASAVHLRARAFRLPRQVVGAGDRGKRRRTDAGDRRAFEGRRVHSWLSRRIRLHCRQSCGPKFSRGTAPSWPIGGSSSMWGSFASFCGSTATPRRSRN